MVTPSFVTLSVTQLNKYVKSVLESDNNLRTIFVKGEISNLKVNSFSGHMYFSLKDDGASVRAVMFRSYAEKIKFSLKEGMSVICSCSVNLYEKDGNYQIYVTDIIPDGVGSIAIVFEQLKEKLSKEGLFDSKYKKPLPKFASKIAVITSATGAAVRDMINVISRRWPIASIVMCPVSVQGELAANQMVHAIKNVNLKTDCDVIIIGRGGGSAEDLWCFNDESLARAIFDSKIPVISAVGHETDFTLCDFVADLRAPTPSAAAELAVPNISDIRRLIDSNEQRMKSSVQSLYNIYQKRYESVSKSSVFLKPTEAINVLSLKLDGLFTRLEYSCSKISYENGTRLAELISKLEVLDPLNVLKRGFTVALKDEKHLMSISDVCVNDDISIRFADGTANCTVTSVERNKK